MHEPSAELRVRRIREQKSIELGIGACSSKRGPNERAKHLGAGHSSGSSKSFKAMACARVIKRGSSITSGSFQGFVGKASVGGRKPAAASMLLGDDGALGLITIPSPQLVRHVRSYGSCLSIRRRVLLDFRMIRR